MIQTVQVSDSGEYSVVAGSSISRAHLTVEGRDIQISEPQQKEITVSVPFFFNSFPISVKDEKIKSKNKILSAGSGEASGNF